MSQTGRFALRSLTLHLTPAECQWFAANLSPDDVWPPSDQMNLLEEDEKQAGGPRFRARILSLALSLTEDDDTMVSLALSPTEVWLLDSVIVPFSPSDKTSDGEPLRSLAEKVWRLTPPVLGDEDEFQQELARWTNPVTVKEGGDAREDHDQD